MHGSVSGADVDNIHVGPPEAAHFSSKMTVLGDVQYVLLSGDCLCTNVSICVLSYSLMNCSPSIYHRIPYIYMYTYNREGLLCLKALLSKLQLTYTHLYMLTYIYTHRLIDRTEEV